MAEILFQFLEVFFFDLMAFIDFVMTEEGDGDQNSSGDEAY